MFWVISVYFNIRNTLPKFCPFLRRHPVYIYTLIHCIYEWTRLSYFYLPLYFIFPALSFAFSLSFFCSLCSAVRHWSPKHLSVCPQHKFSSSAITHWAPSSERNIHTHTHRVITASSHIHSLKPSLLRIYARLHPARGSFITPSSSPSLYLFDELARAAKRVKPLLLLAHFAYDMCTFCGRPGQTMSFLCAINRQVGTHMHGGWLVYCDVVMAVYRHCSTNTAVGLKLRKLRGFCLF